MDPLSSFTSTQCEAPPGCCAAEVASVHRASSDRTASPWSRRIFRMQYMEYGMFIGRIYVCWGEHSVGSYSIQSIVDGLQSMECRIQLLVYSIWYIVYGL